MLVFRVVSTNKLQEKKIFSRYQVLLLHLCLRHDLIVSTWVPTSNAHHLSKIIPHDRIEVHWSAWYQLHAVITNNKRLAADTTAITVNVRMSLIFIGTWRIGYIATATTLVTVVVANTTAVTTIAMSKAAVKRKCYIAWDVATFTTITTITITATITITITITIAITIVVAFT